MKKIGIIWIVLVLLLALALTSCTQTVEKIYMKDLSFTTPSNLHDILLNNIDLTAKDLNLTKKEQEVVDKYSKYGNVLRAATYEWPSKSENIDYDGTIFSLGVDSFEVEALSKILGINIISEQMSFNEAIKKLESGQVDFIPGIYMSPRIKNKGLFLQNGTVTDFIYAYSLDEREIKNIIDLEDLRIGVINNFNVMSYQVEENLNDANIEYGLYKDYVSEYSALKALKDDEIDILLQTFSTNLIFNQCHLNNISQIFPENFSNIMFTEKNEDIETIISIFEKVYSYNDYMKALKQNYMDSYSLMTVSTGAIFTEEEQEYLTSRKESPLDVLAVENGQPYVYYDAFFEEWMGITYKIWDAVAQTTGLEYNIIETGQSSTEIIDAISQGNHPDNSPVILPMYVSPEKLEHLIFSKSVVDDKFVVVGLHKAPTLFEIYDLSNRSIGIVEGSESADALKKFLPNESYYSDYSSTSELITDLLAGFVEYIVIPESEFNDYFYERRTFDIAIKYEISDATSAIAFIDNDEGRLLQSIYNKVVPFIKPGQIVEEFITINTDINEVMKSRNRDMLIMFIFMFLVIVGFLVFFLFRMNRANKRVREIAFVNTVTGLQNRTAFYNENTLATGSLIFVDIDNFKRLNDVHGHDIGDMYAFEIAQRVSTIANENDMLAYAMDIDSILLLDDGTHTEDKLVSIAAKILYEVTKSVKIYDVEHKQTASIGIAIKKDEKGMEELFKKVDTALFLAKQRGKNRYVIASEDEFVAHRKKQFLNEQLSQETIQNEIEPYYQPKVDIRDGRIIGVEALARWKSKEQGMIYPDEIIPVLTENGTLPILDISILTKACQSYVEWMDKKLINRGFIVSCNMSYLTIEQFDIVAAVTQIHENIGMPYRSLEIEIKEIDFIEHKEEMNEKLIELARLGVNISIDNFKAEQSTMTQISKLPINVIKVDKSLMGDGITKKVKELLELISTLTKNLNLGLIIEGVETAEQIQILKEIPIYRVQGYYYGDAIDKAVIENNLRVKYIYR